jgi:phosphoribosylamine--glycine ligase
MVTKNGAYLLEYNMRFGDPETQVLMALMENNLWMLFRIVWTEKTSSLNLKTKKQFVW